VGKEVWYNIFMWKSWSDIGREVYTKLGLYWPSKELQLRAEKKFYYRYSQIKDLRGKSDRRDKWNKSYDLRMRNAFPSAYMDLSMVRSYVKENINEFR
jgi:hypothetical protein